MDKEAPNLEEMQALEQRLNNILLQKQAFQIEFSENQSALREIDGSEGEVFRVVGQMMVKADRKKMKEELLGREKILDMRIKSIEKQESSLMGKLDGLREEFLKSMKKRE
jgi:prefoldin beta subunit